MKLNTYLFNLEGHTRKVQTIKWSPTGKGTVNPKGPSILASASFDSTVRIWDIRLGLIIRVLRGHSKPVMTLAFSPNGIYLATGSLDHYIHIWTVQTGLIFKSYNTKEKVLKVVWNRNGSKIGYTSADGSVCVLDLDNF